MTAWKRLLLAALPALLLGIAGCYPYGFANRTVPLRSTVLRAATYNRATQTLCLDFTSGRRFVYAAVPESIFAALRESDRPGRYFNTRIKPYYAAVRVPVPAP